MFKEVWSDPDTNSALKVADELFTYDFVLHDWTGDSYGLENHKKGIADNRLISPDWNEQPLDIVAEGDKTQGNAGNLRIWVTESSSFVMTDRW